MSQPKNTGLEGSPNEPTEVLAETEQQRSFREWEEWSAKLGQSLVDNLNHNVKAETKP